MAGTQRMVFDPTVVNGVRAETPAEQARAAGSRAGQVLTVGVPSARDTVRTTAGPLAAAAVDFLGNQAARVQTRAFVEGLLGVPAPEDVAVKADPVAAARQTASPGHWFDRPAATAAPGKADPTSAFMDFLAKRVKMPMSLREATAYGAMLPAPPRTSQADVVKSAILKQSQDQYDKEIAGLNLGLKNGEITPEQHAELGAKAFERNYVRQAGLFGYDPNKTAMAELLDK